MSCSGAYGLLSRCLGEPGADTRPFDPYYFPLQTIDFNYQAPLSATASLPACVPRSTDEIRVIICNMAACSCHFRTGLPITLEGNLMVFILVLLLRDDTGTAGLQCVKGASHTPTYRWAFQCECVCGAERWEAGQGARGDLKKWNCHGALDSRRPLRLSAYRVTACHAA